jgi:squalene-hopene/tetraprenyl-beta-curcumene cyclase
VFALIVVVAFSLGGIAAFESPQTAASYDPAVGRFPLASPDEPIARELSPAKAADYLDRVALAWTRDRKCGTCHTNYAYLMGRPALGGTHAATDEIRRFFENRADMADSTPPIPHALILSATLAINDAQTTGTLQPSTRRALDRLWTVQASDGAWTYPNIFYSPPLGDSYYGAVMVALGVGVAPDHYADTDAARAGMAKLRHFLQTRPAPILHHRTMLLWASARTPGLMTKAEQDDTVRALLRLQRADGGWSLPSLGDWKRRDGSPNDPSAPSDGYATGLIVYVLHEVGPSVESESLRAGVAWLRTHQRESGRWFTKSINTDDKGHLISNIGTAYAVMALRACGELDSKTEAK